MPPATRKQVPKRLRPLAKSAKPAANKASAAKSAPAQRPPRSTTNLPEFNAQSFLDTVGVGRFIGKYRAGEAVFLQGDAADAVFYIQKGKVQITVLSKQGKEGVIALLGAGEFFGEGCLAGQPLHIASATATTEAAIVKIEKHAMIRVLRNEPTLSHMFMSFLLSRNIQVEADLIDHLFNSSEKRLARVLLLLANMGSEGKMQTVPKINQEILAARVGTTRSRINFFMNKFRKLGFIEYNGTLKVHSSLMNVIVHD